MSLCESVFRASDPRVLLAMGLCYEDLARWEESKKVITSSSLSIHFTYLRVCVCV